MKTRFPVTPQVPTARAALLLVVLVVGTVDLTAQQGNSGDEYFRRIAALPPRDAEAYYALGLWCASNGLEDQSRQLYERTVRIDPDHGEARVALGYRRYGLRWIIGDQPSRPRRSRAIGDKEPSSGTRPKAESASSPRKKGATPKAPPKRPAKRRTKSSKPTSEAERALEKKRQFAKKAAQKAKTEFHTREDSNFLIHTTHGLSSAAFRELNTELKAVAKSIRTTLGLSSRGGLWPSKIQLFFVESSSEYKRIADRVDDLRSAPREGFYIADRGHVVFYRLDSAALGRHLAEEAIGKLSGSKEAGWWLRVGAGELVAAKTPNGVKDRIHDHAFDLVASMLEADESAFHVKDLLESKGPGRNRVEGTAQALTLVDFLNRSGRSKLSKLIRRLNSDEAPRLFLSEEGKSSDDGNDDDDDDDDDEEENDDDGDGGRGFREFFVEYIVFQEEAIADVFRLDVAKLDEKWKRFLLKQAGSARERLKGKQGK